MFGVISFASQGVSVLGDSLIDAVAMLPPREARIAYLLGPKRCGAWQPLATAVADPLAAATKEDRKANLMIFARSWIDRPFVFRCGANASQIISRRLARRNGSNAYLRSFALDLENFCRMAQLTSGLGVTVQLGDGDLRFTPHQAPGGRIYTKARVISTRCGSLLPLSTNRLWAIDPSEGVSAHISSEIQHPFGHYGLTSRNSIIQFTTLVPWGQKQGAFVWRGASTGYWHRGRHLRRHFVHTMSGTHNVRFTGVAAGRVLRFPCAADVFVCHPNHTGKAMSRMQVLQYKYALSLEGNDCASNLKWLMAQNSVVVMPQPRTETWLMEGLLRPWVHYVPLDDPTRADALLEWLETHESECMRIVRNANAWIQAIVQDLFGVVAPVMQSGTVQRTVRR